MDTPEASPEQNEAERAERPRIYVASLSDYYAGVLHGTLRRPIDIVEAGLHYGVDVVAGQKTGFYLDQRDNRALVGAHAAGRRVLNAFCYTGAFALAALAGGAASVLSNDTSADALRLALDNLARNPALDATRATWAEADVFVELRALRNRGAQFDLIVLDPPKFAPTAAHARGAARAYKDINLLALKLLAPGGLLATFSCSGGIAAPLFQKIVAGAALDAGVDARRPRRRSSRGSARARITRSRSTFPKASI